MTTCTPIKPFRCWQYRKDSTEPVPEWAWGAVEASATHKQGYWLVEIRPESPVQVFRSYWYTPAEFAERFRVEP
jgi:hypothetical protein